MSKNILLVAILAVIGAGVFAAFGGLVGILTPRSTEQTFTTIDGECQIRVYNDPLYAEHWAKEVNPYNCKSYLVQEQANNIKADTRRVNTETNGMVVAVYSIFGVVFLTLVVIVIAVFKGGG
jgi:hypothetical protein